MSFVENSYQSTETDINNNINFVSRRFDALLCAFVRYFIICITFEIAFCLTCTP